MLDKNQIIVDLEKKNKELEYEVKRLTNIIDKIKELIEGNNND